MRNTDTCEEFEINLPYSELDKFLEDNVNIKQIFNKFPGYGDPIRLGVRKNDEGFKEVLGKVKENHKYSTIDVR